MHIINKLPPEFYSITHPKRWVDPYAGRLVLTPTEIADKNHRNEAYTKWIGNLKPRIKGKQMLWQAIRVLTWKHSERSGNEWWDRYCDAVFRVFVNPETVYDGVYYKQWYLLSVEDCYLVNRYEMEKSGPTLPPRDWITEKHVSTNKRLRRALMIPCESCEHLRHDTFAGKLPEGL